MRQILEWKKSHKVKDKNYFRNLKSNIVLHMLNINFLSPLVSIHHINHTHTLIPPNELRIKGEDMAKPRQTRVYRVDIWGSRFD